jgi:vitamin B12 transporter
MRPDENFLARLSYTRLDARDRTHEAPLPRRPKDTLALNIQMAFAKKWDAGLTAVYTGVRPDRDYASWPVRDVTLAGYALLGANLAFNPTPGLQIFARLENILNARYETVFGYGTPGFSAQGGLRLSI